MHSFLATIPSLALLFASVLYYLGGTPVVSNLAKYTSTTVDDTVIASSPQTIVSRDTTYRLIWYADGAVNVALLLIVSRNGREGDTLTLDSTSSAIGFERMVTITGDSIASRAFRQWVNYTPAAREYLKEQLSTFRFQLVMKVMKASTTPGYSVGVDKHHYVN